MGAFLDLVATQRVRVESLITSRIGLDEAESAYERLATEKQSPLAIVLEYAPTMSESPALQRRVNGARPGTAGRRVGVVGAGSFAQSTLIPGLKSAGFDLVSIASATGRSAHGAKDQFGFNRLEAVDELLAADDIDVVAIASRHSSHAPLALQALQRGKAVFVEKPPCLTHEELQALREATAGEAPPLVAGFNRRHAPLAAELRSAIRRPGRPFELLFRINAGALPDDHWLNDPDEGGGRLLGEGCHFVDFACWFAEALPRRVIAHMRAAPGWPLASAQSFSVTLDFADGSFATILYSAGGGQQLPKEYVEAHSGGRSTALDDFTALTPSRGERRGLRLPSGRNKGHNAQFVHFREMLEGRTAPAAPDPLDTMAVTLAALRSAETGMSVALH
jgi:predicted dehydrogenase